MPGLFPNPSAAPECFQPGDQVRWYVGDAHISPYVGVVMEVHPGIQKVDVEFPVGGSQRLSPEDLILVTRFVGQAPLKGDSGYQSYDKARSLDSYGSFKQNLREMAKVVGTKKASQNSVPMARSIAEKFASEVVGCLADDLVDCASKGMKDVAAYQLLYPKYASRCSDAFLRGAVKRVYASLPQPQGQGSPVIPWKPSQGQSQKSFFRDVHPGERGLKRADPNHPEDFNSADNYILFLKKTQGALTPQDEQQARNKWQASQSDWKKYERRVLRGVNAAEKTEKWTVDNTELDEWSERDRNSVILKDKASGKSIMEWWDEDVHQAVEDGFLVMNKGKNKLHESAVEYANEHKLEPRSSDDWHKSFQESEKYHKEEHDREEAERFMFDIASKVGIKNPKIDINIHTNKASIMVGGIHKDMIQKLLAALDDADVDAKEERIPVWVDNSKQINNVVSTGVDDIVFRRKSEG